MVHARHEWRHDRQLRHLPGAGFIGRDQPASRIVRRRAELPGAAGVFIGDSIARGWIATEPVKVDGSVRIGRGIASQTSADVCARFVADALALHPGIIHILVGTSDIAGSGGPMTFEDTRDNLSAMAAGARAIIGTLLPTTDYFWHHGLQPAPKIARVNAWIKQEAAAKHYILTDYLTPLAAQDGSMTAEYTHDGTHPNAAGHIVMDRVLARAIAAAR